VRFQDGAGLAWSDSELTKELWRGKSCDAPTVSTVLTLTAHRRRTPRRNRRMTTTSTGCLDGWLLDVSAVDTGLLAQL